MSLRRPEAAAEPASDTQLTRVAGRTQAVVGYGERGAKLYDQLMLSREIGLRGRNRLELDEAAETDHLVQVDPHRIPQEEVPPLVDDASDPQCGLECRPQKAVVVDLGNAIAAWARVTRVGALELDQMRSS